MNEKLKEAVGLPVGIDKPRLGFLGVGWIGRNRMESVVNSNIAEIVAIADPVRELTDKARELAPGAKIFSNLHELFYMDLDGLFIATPSAMHADQTIEALGHGIAVFCQKPLGRNSEETRRVVEAARYANRLLGVDLSYRYLRGMQKIKQIIKWGELGNIYSVNLVFYNAYGPDKEWFYDPKLSGGGCVIDLGIHLVDLMLWVLDHPRITNISSRLYAQGRPVVDLSSTVEDYATVQIDLDTGATVNLSCSWRQSAGCDAVIEATFYGSQGGLSIRNVNGTFYDFRTERYRWTAREVLDEPPDDWGPKAAIEWTKRLAKSNKYDKDIEHIIGVSGILDGIYGRINFE